MTATMNNEAFVNKTTMQQDASAAFGFTRMQLDWLRQFLFRGVQDLKSTADYDRQDAPKY